MRGRQINRLADVGYWTVEAIMEAIVDVSAVNQELIAQWLMDTTGSQESAVQAATLHLQAAQSVPKFALFLLMLSAGLSFSSS